MYALNSVTPNEDTFSTTVSSNVLEDFHNDCDTLSNCQEKLEIECIVCGDKSSGRHYGQYTCEGCKSFFKRSIRNQCVYQCRNLCQCIIDMQRRNHCQFCRLQKCFSVGMRKEAVQMGRCSSTSNSIPDTSDQWPRCSTKNNYPNFSQPLLPSINPSQGNFQYEISWRLLTYTLDWISHDVRFMKYLNENDQYMLLKSNWHIILAVEATKLNVELPFGRWISEKMVYHSNGVIQAMPQIKFIEHQLKKIQSLKLSSSQFNWLQFIILYNPDVYGLSAISTVNNIQQSLINSSLGSRENNWVHIQILLMIRSLSTFNHVLLEDILFGDLIYQGYFMNVNQVLTKWILHQNRNKLPSMVNQFTIPISDHSQHSFVNDTNICSIKRETANHYKDGLNYEV